MKLAFFSDIHANLPALEAFFGDIDQVEPDMIYCLGDLVGYCTWPNEVISEIRKRRIPTIMGNHDEAQMFPFSENDSKSNRGITNQLLSDDNINYLINLPRHLSLDFETDGREFTIKGVHGSPKAINDYLTEDYPEEEILSMMRADHVDLIICGHTHKPYHRILQDESGFKHIVNIGSVGKPKDGDPRGCYVLVSFDETLAPNNAESISIEFRRFEYDLEKTVEAIKKSDFSDSYAEALIAAH